MSPQKASSQETPSTTEQRLRAIFDGTHGHLALLSPAGLVLEANRALLSFAESTPENTMGVPFWELDWFKFTPDASVLVRDAVARAMAGEMIRLEAGLSTPSGEAQVFDISLAPIRDEHGNVTFIVAEGRNITARKRAEEPLRLSDSRLRMATDAAELGVWTWDVLRDLVTWENEWPYKFFGIDRAEGPINAARFKTEFLHPDDAAAFEAASRRALEEGQLFSFVGRLRRKNGEVRWIEFEGHPTADGTGNAIRMHGTAADVTERKSQQLALERSEARLRQVLNSNVVGMIHWDLDRSLILNANDEFLRMTGYTREDLVAGRINFRALTPPEWTSRNEEGIRAIREQGYATPYEKEYFRKDGSRLPLIIAGTRFSDSPSEGTSFLIDLSERKRAEAAMRQNAFLFSTLIEQAPMGMYAVDSEFRLQQVNTEALPIFANVQPLIGRDFNEVMEILWGPEVGLRCTNIFRHTLETGERYISPPFIEKRHDLQIDQAFEWETQRVTMPDGQYGVVCYFHEITERHLFEEALQKAKEAAEAANRSKDRFLAALSHELRTPLNPVLMAVSALEHEPKLPPEVREDLAMIKRNIELETNLIDDLLDLSCVASGKVTLKTQAINLNQAVLDVCEICRLQLEEKGIQVELNLDDQLPFVSADSARLRQILWNVLKNAIKFTSASSVIWMSTAQLDGGQCEVKVRDKGIGIPPDVLPRIFDAFEQGDAQITRQFGGLGLGLAISRALVELQGGTIRAESKGPNEGATFVIELPCSPTPMLSATPTSAATVDPGGAPIRILLVEDHADTAHTLGRLLRASGFVVVVAKNVMSALATAGQESFDLVVSDLGLPDGDGYEVMRTLRERQGLRGIAMSGYGMEEDIRLSKEAGFIEHLVKPINVPDLIAAIRRVKNVPA